MANAHRVGGPYNSEAYPYADSQGFGLTFVGGDVSYRTDKWGIRIDLRWGQNVDRLTEFAPISRGYLTWIPTTRLTLDMGYFGSFIGIEGADEWENPTFTRGAIYFNIQPFRHLGLRASVVAHEKVTLRFIAARGSIFGTQYPDAVKDTVQVPAFAAQVAYAPNDEAALKLAAVASPNGSNENRNWQAVIDFIAQWNPKNGMLFIDGDYEFSTEGPLTGKNAIRLWGVSVGGIYQFADEWSFGFRGEYLGGDDGAEIGALFTLTGTIRYTPVEYLVLSLEPRAEFADNDIFFARPLTTDAAGNSVATASQSWFFGFWIGATAHFGN